MTNLVTSISNSIFLYYGLILIAITFTFPTFSHSFTLMINLFIIMYIEHKNNPYHHISSSIPYSLTKAQQCPLFHFPTQNQLFLTPTSCSKNCYQTNTHYFLPLYEAVFSNLLTKNPIELHFSVILYRCTILHRISPFSQHSLALLSV